MSSSTVEAASQPFLEDCKPPAPSKSNLAEPTFGEVVAAIYGENFDPETIHVAYFKGDPHDKSQARWAGVRLNTVSLQLDKGPLEANHFLCLGLMDPTKAGRSLAHVVGHVAFWMDDVGTKVERARVDEWTAKSGLEPTIVIETSPGNFSYLWALKSAVKADGGFDDQTVAAIRHQMKVDGWGDPATQEAARYMRSGFGVNGKAAYRDQNGEPFKVRIDQFNPGARVSLENFALYMIGSKWRETVSSGVYLTSAQVAAQMGAGNGERHASMDDPLVKLAAEVGLNPQPSTRAGVIDCECPNGHNHTGGDQTGYAFINRGMSHCNHASCQHLRSPDFEQMIVDKYDRQLAGLEMHGAVAPNPNGTGLVDTATGEAVATSGRNFLARASFEGIGADGEHSDAIDSLRKAADAIAERHAASGNDQAGSLAERLLGVLQPAGAEFFHSDDDRPYMAFQGRVTAIDRESGWRPAMHWLRRHAKFPTGQTRSTLLELMVAEAFAGKKEEVHIRIGAAVSQGMTTVYVNLMDSDNSAVEIDATGYRMVPLDQVPIRMSNRTFSQPMPKPVAATRGSAPLAWVKTHLNVPPIAKPLDPTDAGVQALAGLMMYLTSQFIRRGSAPHLLLTGPQGSGKTNFAKRLKSLTDPDSVDVVGSLPSDIAGLVAALKEQTSVVLDNASKAKGDEADLFCALSSGTGYQTRALYTNGERSVARAKVSLIFTSIRADYVQRADLMDRTISIQLQPFGAGARKTEQELNAAWVADIPHILDEIFELMSKALREEPMVRQQLKGKTIPRLVDAAIFAESFARAAGWPPMLCMNALMASRTDAADSQLSQDGVAVKIRALLQQRSGPWTGTTEDLLQTLNALPHTSGDASLPHNARGLAAALDRLDGPMRETWGISRTKGPRGSRGRTLELSMSPRH